MTPPIPPSARRKLAENKADKLTDIYTSPSIPVREIAEQSGVEVVVADFGEHKDKMAGFCDFQHEKLYVNADDMHTRRRFTVAHELGHWLLHKDIFDKEPELYPYLPRFSAPDVSNILEQEANHFAANLLVPTKLLRPVKDAPVSTLASVFDVSKTMMEIRLKNV